MDRIGFVGLGNMGLRMATRLARAGYALVVHDSNAAIRASADAVGASWAESPAQVAS